MKILKVLPLALILGFITSSATADDAQVKSATTATTATTATATTATTATDNTAKNLQDAKALANKTCTEDLDSHKLDMAFTQDALMINTHALGCKGATKDTLLPTQVTDSIVVVNGNSVIINCAASDGKDDGVKLKWTIPWSPLSMSCTTGDATLITDQLDQIKTLVTGSDTSTS